MRFSTIFTIINITTQHNNKTSYKYTLFDKNIILYFNIPPECTQCIHNLCNKINNYEDATSSIITQFRIDNYY